MDDRCCEFCGADEELMSAVWIPEWLRETARAARTTQGVTQRIYVCACCYEADPNTEEGLIDGGIHLMRRDS